MGFIGIDRGIEEHWIYKDAEYFKVWFEILLRARFSKEPEKKLIEGRFITIEYGQFVYGRVSWSDRLGVSEQRLRTLFKKLQKDEMVELIQKYSKFSLYSVKNYAKYNQQGNHQLDHTVQDISDDGNQHSNNSSTSNQPAANQQLTTQEQGSNKGNKVNKVKKEKIQYAEFVHLTDEEHEKLSKEYGDEMTVQFIQILDNYKGSKKNGDKLYASDYRAILSWVVKRASEERNKVRPFVQKNGQAQKPQITAARPVISVPLLPDEKRAEIRRVAKELDNIFNKNAVGDAK